MYCRDCGSVSTQHFKAKFKDDTFHYILCCNDCFRRYYTEREGEAYQKVKDQPWLQGESLTENQKEWKRKRKKFLKHLRKLKKQ